MARVLTGIKPTGELHLGNYVGAIVQMLRLAQHSEHEIFFFIADYHALNSVQDAVKLKQASLAMVATYLAFDLDPTKVTLYRQSSIPEIFELTTILGALTPKGLMNRAHAYKAAIDLNQQNGKTGDEIDVGINMGLYNYPILMSADILAFSADYVPVGKDQAQHIEFARDIAGRFNHQVGDVLKLPEGMISDQGSIIPGLDGRKMSKSYGNTIPLFCSPAELKRFVMKKIVTDTAAPEDKKDPKTSTIFQLYQEFATLDQILEMRQGFEQGGLGYGTAKKQLLGAIENTLAGPREKYEALMAKPQELEAVLADGATRARATARKTLDAVRGALGV